MGDRSRIIVKSDSFTNPIHLYGHWAGTDNLTAVARVLSTTDRVGDPSYLTAQLFFSFAVSQNDYDGNLGFGISVDDDNGEYDDNSPIIVFADNGDVAYQDYFYTKQEFLEKFGG